jgi:spore maturation protein CgeB
MLDIKSKRVLFIGDLNEGTRSLMRAQKLRDLCGEVVMMSNTPVPFIAGINKPSFFARVLYKLRRPCDETAINQALQGLVHRGEVFDIFWIEKSIMLRPKTLKVIKRTLPKAHLISISEDDMSAPHNRSYYHDKSLPYYDVVFTTKTYNLHELKQLGAKRTEFFLDSYDEDLHKPSADFGMVYKQDIDVSFVGTYEKERSETIKWLAAQGVRIVVFGNGWTSLKNSHPNLDIQNRPVYGEDYVEVISRSKINLGFLRKINRDQVTSRSMEITGAGGFLLAERTDRHLELFEEGLEAEFFSNDLELLGKIKKYLGSPEQARRIGLAARKRCVHSGYGMREQMVAMLNRV